MKSASVSRIRPSLLIYRARTDSKHSELHLALAVPHDKVAGFQHRFVVTLADHLPPVAVTEPVGLLKRGQEERDLDSALGLNEDEDPFEEAHEGLDAADF